MARSQHSPGLTILGAALVVCWLFLARAWLNRYGLQQLFWFCDVALLLTGVGLLARSSRLLTAQLCAISLFHACWLIDMVCLLVLARSPIGATEYMVRHDLPLFEKLFSAFSHIAVIPLALWGTAKLGVAPRGWRIQWVQTASLFVLGVLFTKPEALVNIPFAYRFAAALPNSVRWALQGGAMLLVLPFAVFLPTNRLLLALMPSRGTVANRSRTMDLALSSAAVLALTAASLGLSWIAEQKYPRPYVAIRPGKDGLVPSERADSPMVKTAILGLQYQGAREQGYVVPTLWRQRILPRRKGSSPDFVHTRDVLNRLDIAQIPRIAPVASIVGQRTRPGTAVWAVLASDRFYLQENADLNTHDETYVVPCQFGGPGLSEFVDPITGRLYRPTVDNEIVGDGLGAVYAVAAVETSGDTIVAVSPFYLVVRAGIRYPDDEWQHPSGTGPSPFLSDGVPSKERRVAFVSASAPDLIFTSNFLGSEVKKTKAPLGAAFTLAPSLCPQAGWIARDRFRLCVLHGNTNSVMDIDG